MDGEMDWITARFLLSAILGVHPLVAAHGAADDEHFPVDDASCSDVVAARVVLPAPEEAAGAVCTVCTEEVAARQPVVRLPCAHWYHAACIAPWLRIRTNCPTCRAELPRDGADERPRPPPAAVRAETDTPGGSPSPARCPAS